ncbi:hypothetical protein [Halorhabdus sp. BNX81]|uniref:hypothetical protein n=1 Tax=Halorhabdus sp. BNX81 TaxID=2980181 RepID=UPI0023DD3917|nr:hypothetical protein [Halorhabdus sp. BNX81]
MMGYSVALTDDGSTALVGVPREKVFDADDESGHEATGSVLVFERESGPWSWQTKLTVDETDEYRTLGGSVSIAADGSTAVVGTTTPKTKTETVPAYMYTRSNGKWFREGTLGPSGGGEDETHMFDHWVTLSDDGKTVFLSRTGYEFVGSAYVFT